MTYTLTPDITPPTLITSSPPDSGAGFRIEAVTLRFDEPIDTMQLAIAGFALTNLGDNFRIGGGDDSVVTLARVVTLSPQRVTVFASEPLLEGGYRFEVDASILSDVAGNQATDSIILNFTSFDLDEQNAVAWVSDSDGDWNNAGNWSTGEVPGLNDAVIIDRKATNVRVTLPSGNIRVRSLVSREEFVMNSGSLTVTEASEVSGRFEIGNGSTLTVDGAQSLFVANNDTKIDGGSLIALSGGQIQLPRATSYTHTAGDFRDDVVLRATGAGSVIDLRNVTSITNGGHRDRITIEALTGGTVDLRGVQNIVDGANGDHIADSTYIRATGTGSLVDLSALSTFDNASGHLGQITADQQAIISLSAIQTQLFGVVVSELNGGDVTGNFVVTNALTAASARDTSLTNSLLNDELFDAFDAAIRRLSIALPYTIEKKLDATRLEINDLTADLLAVSGTNGVAVDRDAAGFGWFIDETPLDDEEFDEFGKALPDGPAAGKYDLLSVVIHELGHLLGLEHGDGLDEVLELGQRQLISDEALDEVLANWDL